MLEILEGVLLVGIGLLLVAGLFKYLTDRLD
jgi:hypothetical protein